MTKNNIGIVYSTVDGQTLKICKKLEYYFKEAQIPVLVSSIEDFKEDISGLHTLIIGASIRYGKHNESVTKFIQENQIALESITTAFFSVNLVARKENKNQPDTNPYLIKFLKTIAWKPTFLEVFAGRLFYKSYPFWDRIMIKLIMKLTDGPTTTKEPIEYTDWNKVKLFAERLIENVEKQQKANSMV